MIFLTFFSVPLLLAIILYVVNGSKVSLKELALQLVLQAVIVGSICAIIYHKNTSDLETWNGRIASKTREVVSCSHAYPCRCRPVSCGKNCTTIHCDICFMHSYDVDWTASTTNREMVYISRVDLQGLQEPSRWSSIVIGEPTSIPHSYTNYVKAAPDSVFRAQGESKEVMPAYPGGYYDHYRLDRLVQVDVSVQDAKEWNKDLSELNADLGQSRQVNVIVVLAKNKPRSWFKTLERSWIGGKKNDVVIVLGIDDASSISWTEVMAWTDYAYFKVRLRDEIQSIGKLDRVALFGVIRADVGEYFKRKSMDDFKYLTSSVAPTTAEFFTGMLVSILAAIALCAWVAAVDIFGDEEHSDNSWKRIFG